MNKRAVEGERVGAISHIKGAICYFYGWGTYVGDVVPPEDVTFCGIPLKDLGVGNPKIVLDNGSVVWGCECFWGDELSVKKRIDGLKIIQVDIDKERELRQKAASERANSD